MTLEEFNNQKNNPERVPESPQRSVERHRDRIREARRAFKRGGTGHIDFAHRTTGTYPLFIQQGLDNEGKPATPKSWLETYTATYGFNPEFDNPADKETPEEFQARAIEYAKWAFGPDAPAPGEPNPELLKGILELFGVSDNQETEEKQEETDPLAGTNYEGVPDAQLDTGGPLPNPDPEKGKFVRPEEEGYREAFARSKNL